MFREEKMDAIEEIEEDGNFMYMCAYHVRCMWASTRYVAWGLQFQIAT